MSETKCIKRRFSQPVYASLAAAVLVAPVFRAPAARAALLLNDTWADGSRAESNLPTESATWVGVSSTDGGSLTVVPGALKNVIGTSSRKNWTYFTADSTVPDGNQPHNSVPHLNVGDTLTASITFTMPNAVTNLATSAGRDFRFGLFFDPTDARVQLDANSDGGGSTSPWADATGYGVQIPLNSNPSNTTNLFQISKRTTSNTSLFGSSGALTNAPSGGAPLAAASNVSYTAELSLVVISASELDVTANFYNGATLVSTQTVQDLGTTFGGTAVASGLLPGSQSIYTNFDQLFFRMGSNTETSEIDFTNFKINYVAAPEPTSLSLLAFGVLPLLRRRRS